MEKITIFFFLFFLFIADSYGEEEIETQIIPVTSEEREYNHCVFINIIYRYGETNDCLYSIGAVTKDGVDLFKSKPCIKKTALKIQASVENCTTHKKEIAEMKVPEIASKKGDDYYFCVAKGVAHEYLYTKPCLVDAKAMSAEEELGINITPSGHLDFVILAYSDTGTLIIIERELDPVKSDLCLRASARTMKAYINNYCSL